MKRMSGTRNVLRSLFGATVFLAMGLLLLSCGGDEDSNIAKDVGGTSTLTGVFNVACTDGAIPIVMENNSFNPQQLTAPENSVIKWTNNDPAPHKVTSAQTPEGASFQSEYLQSTQYVCFRFASTGTYNYFCSNHMEGIITITSGT